MYLTHFAEERTMKIKLISGLEKCFLDEALEDKKEYLSASCFKNELFHFGLCFENEESQRHNPDGEWKNFAYL